MAAGQWRLLARDVRSPGRWPRQWAATRGLHGRWPPRRPRLPGSVWAVMMVRDELDVLPHVLTHTLAQGIDRILVADNLSRDGSTDLLRRRAADDRRIVVLEDREPAYYQSEKMSNLARLAWWGGADWVLPVDADEFWFARDTTVAEHLRASAGARVYGALHHMVPTVADPADLVGAEFVVDATPSFPAKVAFRSHPAVMLSPGNHDATRVGPGLPGLFVAHAIYRGPGQIRRKVRQGAAAYAVARPLPGQPLGAHWTRGARLDDDTVERVWDRLAAGLPDERIGYAAHGPMVRTHPLTWRSWDPDQLIPDGLPARPAVDG